MGVNVSHKFMNFANFLIKLEETKYVIWGLNNYDMRNVLLFFAVCANFSHNKNLTVSLASLFII